MHISNFNYNNTEVIKRGGKKFIHKITIKNGKGYKSVTKYNKGKKQGTIKQIIDASQIQLIKLGKLVPSFFTSCGCNKKTQKRR